ncbi:MAG: carbohydrate ABC transporter permease [Lachnospiraceae bacterium]|jgi:multiple sugar transport system permease protein|nr:carbohydrate ABC transporter permease [Lachnospiraceae bacterium]
MDARQKRALKRHICAGLTHAFIIVLGVGMLYPVVWMLASSFKPNNMIFSNTGLIPQVWTAENYLSGWKGYGGFTFGRFFVNSLTICAISVVANLFSCTMAAYAFGRLRFAGRNLWFTIMLITLMLPGQVTLVPKYIMFNDFGWVRDGLVSFLPIIVPKILATDAFFVFLLVQFIRGLPKEMDEAATIDGCSKVGIFTRIVLPLSGPALVTTALFTFLWSWDDFFNHLLYLTSPATYTVSRALRTFIGDAGSVSNWGGAMAMATLSVIPCFVLFFALQKYFVEGIATSGIKG